MKKPTKNVPQPKPTPRDGKPDEVPVDMVNVSQMQALGSNQK